MREGKHEHKGHKEHRENCGHPHDDGKRNFQSAQTFRRGRAIAFLDRLHVKRSTLMQQLDQPEFEAIRQVISGELKATDGIIQEFIQAFELREVLAEQENTTEGVDINHDNH
ncbi:MULTISPECIES: hypothetical protein [Paenibacillus]|jgi:hypothetical protein|uniref:hypothetical protein n=1 Tax=Paenibacillus TaxID=44249 RepID=UPI00096BDC54|nr:MULTISPECIES: hypothetical protein [Paenibacillus]OMF25100.1 hypothetical protein BK132_22765 [Paenibacillus sp. FSL H8-0259]